MENNHHSSGKILNFALSISKLDETTDSGFSIGWQNEGIPAAEILFIVETWLEVARDRFKQPFKDMLSS